MRVVEEVDPCPDKFIDGFPPYKYSIIFNNRRKPRLSPFIRFSFVATLRSKRTSIPLLLVIDLNNRKFRTKSMKHGLVSKGNCRVIR